MLRSKDIISFDRDFFSDETSDEVVRRITGDGRYRNEWEEPFQRKRACGREGARHENQGISRQKWCKYESRFRENNQKQNGVGQNSVACDYRAEIFVEVEDEVDHARSLA